MRTMRAWVGLLLLASVASVAQVAAPLGQPTAPAPAANAPAADPVLLELSQAGHKADADLSRVQIDRWKADSSLKQQAQNNLDSVQRNLREALPALILEAQSAAANVGPQFKLYRNLNALYDVMASLTESAGAFGKKEDYQALAADTQRIDQIRHSLADRIETATAQRDAEMAQLRAAMQRATAGAAQSPKKIVVDDQPAPKKKSARKTTSKQPAAQPKPEAQPK